MPTALSTFSFRLSTFNFLRKDTTNNLYVQARAHFFAIFRFFVNFICIFGKKCVPLRRLLGKYTKKRHTTIKLKYFMKKTLLFALLIASSALLFAAETKKVAILEIEDTENVLDHGQKLMLRSSLAKAVANTPGYEAFDRTSLDAIMEEHNFQRSGFVNQKEIKALGKSETHFL